MDFEVEGKRPRGAPKKMWKDVIKKELDGSRARAPFKVAGAFQVIPAIRLDDAEWKIIQQNTFTRWVNNHLKKAGESIHSL
ncbi:hypothetical protein TELCIR_03111, partial [Teladorsagia circumcincta]